MEDVSGQKPPPLPRSFLLRRWHSLFGLFLTIYLFEHLLTNFGSVFYLKDQGALFVKMVNRIKDLPFLGVIEIALIALPFLYHGVLGVYYLFTAKHNSLPGDGRKPSLPYTRNRAYSFQRWTSWILFFGIIFHVIQMRFIEAPKEKGEIFSVRLIYDSKLEEVAQKLDVQLIRNGNEIVAESKTPGPLFLLVLRDTFKSLWMVIFYSIFVVASCFHGFNGLWTFMITWGVTLSQRTQAKMRMLSDILMGVTLILGLGAVWGPYLIFWRLS